MFVDGARNLYIADTWNNRIRRVDATTGVIATVAGHGPFGGDLGDGRPATQARLDSPRGLFVDGAGDLYIADTSNNRIRRMDATTGVMTTVAGNGEWGFSGDGGPATQASLTAPEAIFVDGTGDLYIADTWTSRIRRVDAATGVITTVAGSLILRVDAATGDVFSEFGRELGDGGPATQAGLDLPGGVFVDGAGSLYIADSGNNRIRKVTFTPTITVVADRLKQDQTATAFALAPNYPNPFNPYTRIRYQLAQAGPVPLTIYNVLGQNIRVLVQEPQEAGFYHVIWDGTYATGQLVAAGLYVYRLTSRQGVLTRRMMRLN